MEKEALERLGRLENHFKVYKVDVSDIKDSVTEIRILLGGTELNGKKGFVYLMETIEQKVNKLEKDLDDAKHTIRNAKGWGQTITALIMGLILVLANYFKDKLN